MELANKMLVQSNSSTTKFTGRTTKFVGEKFTNHNDSSKMQAVFACLRLAKKHLFERRMFKPSNYGNHFAQAAHFPLTEGQLSR